MNNECNNLSEDQIIETHPWDWYGPQDSTRLIIGTFPPTKRNWSFDFFYPNKRNFFWKIIAAINHTTYQHDTGAEAVQERMTQLDKLKITITDMGQKIVRSNQNSLDENLVSIAYMDILKILEQRPLIQKILLTSSSGKVSAVKWFENYLLEKGYSIRLNKAPKPAKTIINIAAKNIEVVVLYSPSARAANRISFDNLVSLYQNEIV